MAYTVYGCGYEGDKVDLHGPATLTDAIAWARAYIADSFGGYDYIVVADADRFVEWSAYYDESDGRDCHLD